MGRSTAAAALASLGHIGRRYGPGLGTRKLALLATLSRFRLSNSGQVRRLHELLSFLDAYPDDRRVRARVRVMLDSFHRRPDLRRNRSSLAGSGIAGTETPYRFYWPTALWISQVWPGALRIDREDREHAQAILDALPQLLAPPQAELIRRLEQPTLAVLDRIRPRGLTDADFFISLVAAMPGDDFSREAFFDRIDPPFILEPGRTTPERTTARFDCLPLHAQRSALRGARPELRQEARRPPEAHLATGCRGRAGTDTGRPRFDDHARARPGRVSVRRSARRLPRRRWRGSCIRTGRHGAGAPAVVAGGLWRPESPEWRPDRLRAAGSPGPPRRIVVQPVRDISRWRRGTRICASRGHDASHVRLRAVQHRAVPARARQRGGNRVRGVVVLPSLRLSTACTASTPDRRAGTRAHREESPLPQLAAQPAGIGAKSRLFLAGSRTKSRASRERPR